MSYPRRFDTLKQNNKHTNNVINIMKIAVLISGGVDSSLALKLLKDQGHDITSFYLKIWLEDELSSLGSCPWEEDLSYIKKTCNILNVPLTIIPFQKEYHDKVVSYTITETKAGRTPNPDILCNQHIKFGIFYDSIDSSFDKVATGHYAQIEERDGIYSLKRAPDPIKDQTYFLCNLNQKQLSRALFPIGHLTKKKVRELAQKYELPSRERKDSQGICFLGKFKFRDFLAHHLGTKEGKLVEFESGKKIGTHKGCWYYTIGQRQGIRLSDGPWYVVAKNASTNIVYVSKNYEKIDGPRTTFEVSNLKWINEKEPQLTKLMVKIRHRSTPSPCTLELTSNNCGKITLQTKDQGIASGQFAVFYNDDICLGSGIIQ